MLYIIRKLVSRPIIAGHKIYILLKGQFAMYIKQFIKLGHVACLNHVAGA